MPYVRTTTSTWTSLLIMVVFVTIVAMAGLSPAGAQVDVSSACPATIADAGFTDLAGLSDSAVAAVDCLAFYDITRGIGTGTFGPRVPVPRWQMALFLVRQLRVHGVTLPSGAFQGFADISTVSLDGRTAINQLVQLGLSNGTSALTFSPFDVVPRWQMALFITRLLEEIGVGLPSGLGQGFADIGGLPGGIQKAINQLAQLGISEGTTSTTFSPFASVNRAEMALFLTRTLQIGGVVPSTFSGGGASFPRASAPSGAPDLTSVSSAGADADETTLVYRFDEVVSSLVNGNHIWLVGWNGDLINPISVIKSTTDDRAVLAVFSNEDYNNAVAGVVTPGAVSDVDKHANTTGSYPLRSVTVDGVDWPVDRPEVIGIGTFDAVQDTAEFTFDQNVDALGATADHFHLVEKDGTVWTGSSLFSDDGDKTLEVRFANMSTTEFNNVVRGFVEENAVKAAGGVVANVPNGVDRTGAGSSDTPYLASIDLTAADEGVVSFEFNENLADFSGTSGNFQLVLHDGTVLSSTAEARDAVDFDEAVVEFTGGAPLPSDLVIYANALSGAVTGFSSSQSAPDSFLKKHTFRGYDTAGPDLVSSSGSRVGLAGDNFTILFTFDEKVEKFLNPATDLIGWNTDGDLVDISGGTATVDDKEVTIRFLPGATGTKTLVDGDVVRFGIRGEKVEDVFGFTSYPDGVGCGCAK